MSSSRRARQREDWEDLSVLDPYWAICSQRDRRFGGWDREAFLQSGVESVAATMRAAERLGVLRARAAALDFGCGTGRLTLALAREFDHCIGLDVSSHMVEQARELAAGIGNCVFEVHQGQELAAFESASFDLVVSRYVLQHLPERTARERYVAEFVRVLRPGGLLALQIPSAIPARHRIQPRPRLYRLLRRAGVPRDVLYERLRLHPIRMAALSKSRVLALIAGAGGRVLEVSDEAAEGGITSTEYLATKDS